MALFEGGGMRGREDRKDFVLNYNNGKAVQEILNRYLDHLRADGEAYTTFTGEVDRQDEKDIAYITELAKLFD